MSARLASLALGVVTAAVCLFLMAPTFIVAPVSITETDFITFPPHGFSMRWYEAFFTRPEWHGSLVTSLIVAVSTMVAATALGTLVALGLARLDRRAAKAVSFVFLLPMIVPSIITAAALYTPFARLGLVSTVPGLVVAHTILALPFVIINVAAVLGKLDPRLVHAARSLGASPAAAFGRVTLPLLAPGVIAGALFAFLTSFDEVVIALFISGAGATTLPVQMWSGIRFEVSPIVAAASCLLLVVSCLLLALFGVLKRR